MFHLYNQRSREALFFARQEASELGGAALETEHLLLGLMRDTSDFMAGVFAAAHLSPDAVRDEVRRHFPAREKLPVSAEMPFTEEVVRILSMAAQEAEGLRHDYIGTEHLLLGMLADSDTFAGKLLREKGLDREATRTKIIERPPS